jgi:hypothetical protein
MTDKETAYRGIIGVWRILAGFSPFLEFCEEQIQKLISMHPEDDEIILRAFNEVWPDLIRPGLSRKEK